MPLSAPCASSLCFSSLYAASKPHCNSACSHSGCVARWTSWRGCSWCCMVGLGDVKAAKAFCQLTRIPEESVYASPTAAPYDALGYQPGFARPSPPALLKPKCGALPPSSYMSAMMRFYQPHSFICGAWTARQSKYLLPRPTLTQSVRGSVYSDEQVANRDVRVWHGATENGP